MRLEYFQSAIHFKYVSRFSDLGKWIFVCIHSVSESNRVDQILQYVAAEIAIFLHVDSPSFLVTFRKDPTKIPTRVGKPSHFFMV